MPATHCGADVGRPAGANALLFDVGAHGEDFDGVGVPEVVAEVEFGEGKGDAEPGVVGVRGAVEG